MLSGRIRPSPSPRTTSPSSSELHRYRVQTWVTDIVEPWSLAFLPDGRALATEKRGNLLSSKKGAKTGTVVKGTPPVDQGEPGGTVRCRGSTRTMRRTAGSISRTVTRRRTPRVKKVSLTRIIRGHIKDGAWTDEQTIFQARSKFIPALAAFISAVASCSTGRAISSSRSANAGVVPTPRISPSHGQSPSAA